MSTPQVQVVATMAQRYEGRSYIKGDKFDMNENDVADAVAVRAVQVLPRLPAAPAPSASVRSAPAPAPAPVAPPAAQTRAMGSQGESDGDDDEEQATAQATETRSTGAQPPYRHRNMRARR